MRGVIDFFDVQTDEGEIAGEDGVQYRFGLSDLASAMTPAQGRRVEFRAEGGNARDISIPRAKDTAGRFDMGRVIQRTFSAIAKNWAIFFGSAIVLVGLPSVLNAWGRGEMALIYEGAISPARPISLVLIGSLLTAVGSYILQGMAIKAAVNGFGGRNTPLAQAFDVGLKRFLPLFGLAIVAGLATGVGLLLLIVPGLILIVLWSVASPALVVEKRGVFESLERSSNLTKGYRWQIFGLLVIGLILVTVVGGVIGAVGLAIWGLAPAGLPHMANVVTSAVSNVLSSVVASAGVASLYYELRTAKEGIGADELAAVFD